MAERCGLMIPVLLCEALQRGSVVRFRDAKLKLEYGMTYRHVSLIWAARDRDDLQIVRRRKDFKYLEPGTRGARGGLSSTAG